MVVMTIEAAMVPWVPLTATIARTRYIKLLSTQARKLATV